MSFLKSGNLDERQVISSGNPDVYSEDSPIEAKKSSGIWSWIVPGFSFSRDGHKDFTERRMLIDQGLDPNIYGPDSDIFSEEANRAFENKEPAVESKPKSSVLSSPSPEKQKLFSDQIINDNEEFSVKLSPDAAGFLEKLLSESSEKASIKPSMQGVKEPVSPKIKIVDSSDPLSVLQHTENEDADSSSNVVVGASTSEKRAQASETKKAEQSGFTFSFSSINPFLAMYKCAASIKASLPSFSGSKSRFTLSFSSVNPFPAMRKYAADIKKSFTRVEPKVVIISEPRNVGPFVKNPPRKGFFDVFRGWSSTPPPSNQNVVGRI